MLRKLRDASGRDISSCERALALKTFVDWCDPTPLQWKTKYRVERQFVVDAIERIESESRRRGETSPFTEGSVDAEDEIALARIFGRP